MTIDPSGKLASIQTSLPRGIADQAIATLKDAVSRLEKMDIKALVTHHTFTRPNVLSVYFGVNLGLSTQSFFKHKERIEAEIDRLKKKKSGISLTPVSLCSALLQVVDGISYVLIGSEKAYITLPFQDFEALVTFIRKLD